MARSVAPKAQIRYASPRLYDPERAQEQTQRRRETLAALTEFGEELAAKLDAQDAGLSDRGRRASDRGAYTRFTRAVFEAHCSRFITPALESERFAFSVDEEAIANAERLDGKLVLITNVTDLQAEDVVERYKALADIERGFRLLKRDIEIAPVYHYKPNRIRAHAMICFLALLLHRVMRLKLRQKGSTFSVERAIHKLRGIQLHRVQIGTQRLRGLTKITPEQLQLFETFGATRPAADAL